MDIFRGFATLLAAMHRWPKCEVIFAWALNASGLLLSILFAILPAMKINIGRNEPCPCGSGKKFKKGHMNNPADLFPKYTPTMRWSQDEIRDIPTENIIETLCLCGIDFDRGEFQNDIKEVNSAREIYERWKERFEIKAEGCDVDFIWMACEILWERMEPDKASHEQIDDMMQKGYDLIQNENTVEGCTIWLKAWEALKPKFAEDMKKIEDADDVFKGYQFLSNWCQDLEQELGNASIDNPSFYDKRIKYCREFLDLFPESDELLEHNMRRSIGEALFGSGRREEGEREFQRLVNDFPDTPWGYIGWGDIYTGMPDKDLIDDEKAEELYTKALGIDEDEDEIVRERLRDLKGTE